VTADDPKPSGRTAAPPAPVAPASDPGCGGSACAYDGTGFVVHEWGTNTFVVGSDGVPLRGLHHEEEDLPPFVYDRVKAGSLPGSTSVDAKMETPVLYFYSPTAMTAKVSVQFPQGVLTQWYPAARSFYPMVAERAGAIVDPLTTATCSPRVGFANGLLDWGDVQVLARDANVDAVLPFASLDRYTWSHARAVAANPVRVAGAPGAEAGQSERFLFYRGLGNFPPPAKVSWDRAGGVRVQNPSSDGADGPVFVLNVGQASGAFAVLREGIAPGASATVTPPPDGARKPIDTYVDELSTEVVRALDGAGLYHDEAMSMVNTWRRQWFRTPGLRVLYLASPSWIDRSIPLSIEPKPAKTARAMVIRIELLTPAVEEVDAKMVTAFGTDADGAARAHFDALGRFAEPRLRRAIALLAAPAPAAAQAYLASIAKTNTSAQVGD
jgi:hypothetical protein